MLFKSLLSADNALMNAVARGAVDRYAGMEPGRPVGRHLLPLPGPCGTWTSTAC